MPVPIDVLVVDDDPGVRAAVWGLLDTQADLRVVGEAHDAPSAVARCVEVQPDVVVLDLRMPGGGGEVAAEEIARRCPATAVVIMTSVDDAATRRRMSAAGAVGYIVKGQPASELYGAIRSAASAGWDSQG